MGRPESIWGRIKWYFSNIEEVAIESWEGVFEHLKTLPRRAHIKIHKQHLHDKPPWECSRLGFRKKSMVQYRSDNKFMSIHVREYGDHYVAHIDLYSPKLGIKDTIMHWIYDVPEYLALWIAVLIVTGLIAYKTAF